MIQIGNRQYIFRILYKTGKSSDHDPDFVASEGDMVLAMASDKYW